MYPKRRRPDAFAHLWLAHVDHTEHHRTTYKQIIRTVLLVREAVQQHQQQQQQHLKTHRNTGVLDEEEIHILGVGFVFI